VTIVQSCNPSYLGGCGQNDHSLRPVWANSSPNHISKINTTKWTGGMAEVVDACFVSTNT
jgi:hypothetical protein